MLDKSTNREDYQRVARPVGAMAKRYADGYASRWHRHVRAQLLYAITGILEVETPMGTWIVPPQRAVWLPPDTEHEMHVRGAVDLRTLYISPDACPPSMPQSPSLLEVTPLLRELIVRATEAPILYDETGHEGWVVDLILGEMARAVLPIRSGGTALALPWPTEQRLAAVCTALRGDPADPRGLAAWAGEAGMSVRTYTRLFRQQTGLSFAEWRTQARLLAALVRLAAGEPVMSVAFGVGYETPSAFTAVFRRRLGVLPSAFLKEDA